MMDASFTEMNTYTRQRKVAKTFGEVIFDFIEVGQKLDACLRDRQELWKRNGYDQTRDRELADREEDLIVGLLEDSAEVLGLKVYRVRAVVSRLDG